MLYWGLDTLLEKWSSNTLWGFNFEVYESSAMNYKIKEILSFVKIKEKCNRKKREEKTIK